MSRIVIQTDTASLLLDRLQSAAQASGLALVGARAVGGLIKEHLYGLDRERHRSGKHFYRAAGDSVRTVGAGTGVASVSITQLGFRQRLFGGTIVPRNGRTYLTIPASPEAVGMRAGEFSDLRFTMAYDERGAIRPALVRPVSQAVSFIRRKRKDGSIKTTIKPGELRGGVMFWLVRKVTQRADPTVLPYAEQMGVRANAAIKAEVLRLTTRANSAPRS